MPLAPKFSTSAFPIYSCFTFKNFVRSRRDWEKKCREGSRHSPSTNRYGFAKQLHPFCALFALSCPPMGEGGGEEFCWEGGGNRKHEIMMIGDDDEMISFLHSLYNGILRARGEHETAFCFCFLELCFAPCILCFKNRRTLKTLRQIFAPKWKCSQPM